MKCVTGVIAAICLAAAVPVSAQEAAMEKGNRGKTTLIGLAVGAGAALVYGLASDYCTNPDSDYLEHERALFCGLPIAGMVAGGAVAGYFLGHGDRPVSPARQHGPADDRRAMEALRAVRVRLRGPAPSLRQDGTLVRNLWRVAPLDIATNH
jgi:hypothetical protein